MEKVGATIETWDLYQTDKNCKGPMTTIWRNTQDPEGITGYVMMAILKMKI
jgi:hypothetical protein